MPLFRDLTEEEKRFCEKLGAIVIFWNHIEGSFQSLVHFAARGSEGPNIAHRIDVLVSNLGNVSLAEAMQAISEDHEGDIGGHLKHAADLFDALRIYRNYYVHGPITFASTETDTSAMMQQLTAKGGSLRLHQGQVSRPQLEAFMEQLSVLIRYLSALTMEMVELPNRQPLASLEKPPLPDKLELRRLRLIERKRQLLA